LIPETKPDKIIRVAFPIVFVGLVALMFWKCKYGFPYEETFYAYTAFRFINGDYPILHEWHMSQMSHMFLQLPVMIYLKFSSGTEGIILFLRYLYTTLWTAFGAFVYYRTRTVSKHGAMLASLVILVFAPCGQMAIYYYPMGILTLTVSGILLITSQRLRRLQIVTAGIFYSLAVIYCPVLAVLTVPAAVLIITGFVRNRKEYKELLWMLPGILLSVAVFYICVMSHAPLGEYLNVLPNIMSDSEHAAGIAEKTIEYLESVIYVLILVAATFIFAKFCKNRKIIRNGFIAECILSVVLVLVYLMQDSLVNYYMTAFVNIGLYVRLVMPDDMNRKLFTYLWIPGVLYSLCIHFSSNMGGVVISSALTVSAFAGILMAARMITADKEKYEEVSFLCSVTVLILVLTISRAMYVFCEHNVFEQTHKIDQGICKGLMVSDEPYDRYMYLLPDVVKIKNDDSIDRLLIVSNEWWMYLESGKMISSFTAWTPTLTPAMLDSYYNLYPDMRPDAIYIDEFYSELEPNFEIQGYAGNKTDRGGYILYPQ